MASTYSPTLRIELIGDGDQSGIWGQTTNNNLGSLLEQAITGVVTIVMTDAAYTLTSYNGVVDEARNAVIVATGTNSAQRDIIAPLVEKVYTIKNSTTGGYAVRIIGSSGTGVVIPNGVTASVYCDGTNFYPTQVNTIGNATINGNLSVTGTTSLTGSLSGSSATFSGAISSVSPTFTGTPTAPTATSGTNTTQIATTAFVKNSLDTYFPSGTKLMFAQASAPTGWTQITDDSATNRMLRVVNSTGAGTGGSNSPILMDVVPSHTHSFTSGTESAGHTHAVTGYSGYESADHAHYLSANTGTESSSHDHYFVTSTVGNHSHGYTHVQSGGNVNFNGGGWADLSGYATTDAAGSHYHDGTTNGQNQSHYHYIGSYTGGVSANHAHYVSLTSAGVSANHTHSGATNANVSSSNWAPRYIDMILCSKN